MQVLSKRMAAGALTGLALMSGIAWAGEAAKVLAVTGTVYALDSSGQKRTLDRKASINEGDTVVSEADSTAQLRFIDGAVMGIKPSSQFKISTYKKPDAGGSGKSDISVAKGGFWTLTGSIAKQNPDNYAVKTNYATIGVRGTAWDLHVGSAKEFMGVYQDCRDKSKTGLHIVARKSGETIDIGPGNEFNFASVDAKGNVQGLEQRPGELNGAGVQAGGAAGRGGAGGGAGAGADGGAAGGGAGLNMAGAVGAAGGNNLELLVFNDAAGLNPQTFLTAAEIAQLTSIGVGASRRFPTTTTISGLAVSINDIAPVGAVNFGIEGTDPNTTPRVLKQGTAPAIVGALTNIAGRLLYMGRWEATGAQPSQMFTDRNDPQSFTPVDSTIYWAFLEPMINPPLAGTIQFNSTVAPAAIQGIAYSGAITADTLEWNYNVTNNTISSGVLWEIGTPSGDWRIDGSTGTNVVNNVFKMTSFGPNTAIDGDSGVVSGSISGVISGSGPGNRVLVLSGDFVDVNNPARFLTVVQTVGCNAALCP